jgi:hypothetical protein
MDFGDLCLLFPELSGGVVPPSGGVVPYPGPVANLRPYVSVSASFTPTPLPVASMRYTDSPTATITSENPKAVIH